MKKLICLFAYLFSCSLLGQSLTVLKVDVSNFPTVRANFYAFNSKMVQLKDLEIKDFQVKENSEPRKVTLVSCPDPRPPLPLSAVLTLDISGSMMGNRIDMAKNAANEFINGLSLGISEAAITSFNSLSYLNQDLTTDKNALLNAISALQVKGGTDYMQALTNNYNGALAIAKYGKNKRIVIFLTDGQPNNIPQTDQIIWMANAYKITIYSVVIGMKCPASLIEVSQKTGGMYYDNITTVAQAKQIYNQILQTEQGSEPCTIEWESQYVCDNTPTNTEITLLPYNTTATTLYKSPPGFLAEFKIEPQIVRFTKCIPGIKRDTTITVTAVNSDFTVTDIKSSDNSFKIEPTLFYLRSGNSMNLKLTFTPVDSQNVYSKFIYENTLCPVISYASASYQKRKNIFKTLKLTHPNGDEKLVAGSDTVIKWEGVLPDEKVRLEYSTDNGTNWNLITESAKGLSYKWHVPKSPSDQCLARVTADPVTPCDVGDVDVLNMVWMGCNLDVDHYQNGDSIPQVQDPDEWLKLKTGAWCYYDNDPNNGLRYGKLYNWYAINDKRGLAPKGWRIATSSDWMGLFNIYGRALFAGGKLKSTGTIEAGDGFWSQPNVGATNESGFTGEPGGCRNNSGLFSGLSNYGYWWMNDYDSDLVGVCYLYSGSYEAFRVQYPKYYGFSVRCVRTN